MNRQREASQNRENRRHADRRREKKKKKKSDRGEKERATLKDEIFKGKQERSSSKKQTHAYT